MCSAFFPLAFAFCVAKPQIGAPVALTRFSRPGVVAGPACCLRASCSGRGGHWNGFRSFTATSISSHCWLCRDRCWPWRFAAGATATLGCSYWPALCRNAGFTIRFILWLIPKTRRRHLVTVACSWVVGLWRWYHFPHTMHQVGLWCVLGFYFPMLIVVLVRPRSSNPQAGEQESEKPVPGQSPTAASAI